MPESSDPYTYPGTDVLRNIPEIRDSLSLAAFEANATAARLAELHVAPLNGRLDIAHLKAIHRYIFQDVYSWAGEFRTVNVSKGGHLFGAARFIEPALQSALGQLPEENYLRTADPEVFARRAAFYLGELNAVHPFRDGNGRAQREFIREIGIQSGFVIGWHRIISDQMIAASRQSFETGNNTGLALLIRACMR